jgi:serine-protein kinase ATM
MCLVGYILGLGDRHVQNILIDTKSAELIHIDLGVAFEQGRILPTPETVPFRLTRDIVDGMGVAGVEGVFRRYSTLLCFNTDFSLNVVQW